ncbi:hypothetical protein C8J30_11347 [Rhodobacter viridis]|uniref:Uncharacterized protein n=1 Tax=Rhodobacter viridis TaxID=1054202 RepID=A0A318TWC0_9RHOB|nr:hypothetical protein [Rhodobacter viridis]PYF08190.1 hypothetical protein C8J30_11347 [Rhodobacter viridis]
MAKICFTPPTASIAAHAAATNLLLTRITAIMHRAEKDPETAAIAAELRAALREAFPELQRTSDTQPPGWEPDGESLINPDES